MKVVVCPDSFKDCASARDVAAAMARGVRRAAPAAEVVELPLADGGEGTVAALVAATGGRRLSAAVQDPLGRPVEAGFGLLGDGSTAVLEMAAASGLERLAEPERDPRRTSTYGTGELIRAALDHGATRLVVGIGGSATNDGGGGLATALGARLLDREQRELPPGGAALLALERIDLGQLEPRLRGVEVGVACDVDNPLCGPRGASAVYGPQKGASPADVAELDRALGHYADILEQTFGRDLRDLPGAGAAGGLGAGLVAFCGATLGSGIELVLDTVGFDEQVRGADLVLTGEGRLDSSTLHGKTVHGVLRRARKAGVPVVALGGAVAGDPAAWREAGLVAALGLPQGPMTLRESIDQAEALLEQTAEAVVRIAGVSLRRV